MADVVIRRIDLENHHHLRQVAVLLFQFEDFYDINLQSNSALWSGMHLAAFDKEGDWVVAYADSQPDGSALLFAGDESLRAKLIGELLGVPGFVELILQPSDTISSDKIAPVFTVF